jgi:putative membrane protein
VEDVDPRVSFANERTMLAWVRTAIALMAGGAALAELSRAGDEGAGALVPAVVLVVVGAVLAVGSIVLWRGRERAISGHRPAPAGWALSWLLGAAIGAATVAAAGVAGGWT